MHFHQLSASDHTELDEAITSLGDDQVLTVYLPMEHALVTRSADGQTIVQTLRFAHECRDGRRELFTMRNESDGTQRLIHLLPALFVAQGAAPVVLVLDEIDRRLHPILTRGIVQAVLRQDPSSSNQMIFTTHDTHLLDAELLRWDEIWFVEKDAAGASHLYSLAEFGVRHDLKLEKGYLNGRFGAIPFLGDLQHLGWLQDPDSMRSEEPAGVHA